MKNNIFYIAALLAVVGLVMSPAAFAATPGTDEHNVGPSEVLLGSIIPVVTETGKVSLSVDGLGTNASSGLVQVDKPVGASVIGAYFAAASVGFSNATIPDGNMTIDGTPVNWDVTTPSSINSWNYWADVTAIVAPIVNGAAAGIVNITIGETGSGSIDGSILAVIFSDPNQLQDNTVVLLFGAQDISGDQFFVSLAEPLDQTDPNLVLDMSLGISYGFQPGGQVSLVDVNGVRLSSSAGGQDDGESANGALLTVGGVGDSNNNPPPNAPPTTPSDPDDELYDIIPFTNQGDQLIQVETVNPSTDDNIFFSAFFLTVSATVTTECAVVPSALDFGTVAVGNSSNEMFRITNVGDATLVGNVTENCDHYSIVAGGGPFQLANLEFVDVIVQFAPTAPGVHTCTIETGSDFCPGVQCTGDAGGDPPVCQQPLLTLLGYRTVSYNFPLWEVQVELKNNGPGMATDVSATMNEDIPWLTVPDPNCFYGDVADGGTTWGDPDTYTFDLTGWQGGSFNVFFDVAYGNGPDCDDQYMVRLDPEFGPQEPTGIGDAVSMFRLGQNHPNPFNPVTEISYTIPSDGVVSLNVYDVSGKLVRSLVSEHKSAGPYSVRWNGKDNFGRSVASGVYFYHMKAGDFSQTKRMVLLK